MRARNIKPGFYKSESLAECSVWARLLFPGLWMIADREGRLEDRPKRIKAELFAYDNIDVDELLEELHISKRIFRYEINGIKYIEILGFVEHQSPHFTEKASLIPASRRGDFRKKSSSREDIPKVLPEHSESTPLFNTPSLPPDSLIPDSLIPDSLIQKGGVGEKVRKVSLEDLSVDHNAVWLAKKRSEGRYLLHDEYFILDQFKQYCRSKGKKYSDYLAAYQNSFEWEKCQPKGQNHGNKPTFKSESERLHGKYLQDAEREEQSGLSDTSSPSLRLTKSIREDG